MLVRLAEATEQFVLMLRDEANSRKKLSFNDSYYSNENRVLRFFNERAEVYPNKVNVWGKGVDLQFNSSLNAKELMILMTMTIQTEDGTKYKFSSLDADANSYESYGDSYTEKYVEVAFR